MAQGFAYRVGRFLGGLPLSAYVLLAAGGALWALAEALPTKERPAQVIVPIAVKPPSAEERCKAQRDQQLATYHDNMKNGLPWQAATSIRACSAVLKDPALQALVVTAELEDAVNTARSKTQPSLHRLQAIERVVTMAPERAAEFAKLKAQLEQSMARDEERERKAVAARKRSEGVHIGMSQEDVLASSWGRPQGVNKTIYSFGVREQWVYGGSNYLYFDDGVLKSIQTGH